MSLSITPITLACANDFVAKVHRHHPPVVGHKFSLGIVAADDHDCELIGVVIVGRPVARHMDDGVTLEVTRCATDGTRNACSFAYAAAWRATKALGYLSLITYTMASESGSSLRGAGWRVIAERPARNGWTTPSRPRADKHPVGVARTLWEAM